MQTEPPILGGKTRESQKRWRQSCSVDGSSLRLLRLQVTLGGKTAGRHVIRTHHWHFILRIMLGTLQGSWSHWETHQWLSGLTWITGAHVKFYWTYRISRTRRCNCHHLKMCPKTHHQFCVQTFSTILKYECYNLFKHECALNTILTSLWAHYLAPNIPDVCSPLRYHNVFGSCSAPFQPLWLHWRTCCTPYKRILS